MIAVVSGCGRNRPEPTATPTKTAEAPSAQTDSGGAVAAATATPIPASQESNQNEAEAAQEPSVIEPNTIEPNTIEQDEPTTPLTAVINADLLNIRSEPTLTSSILREARRGEAYEVAGRSEDNQWAYLATGGQSLGWAAVEFLTLSGDLAAVNPVGGASTAPEPEPNQDTATAEQPTAAPQPPATNETTAAFAPATMNSPDFGGQAFLWWREEIADRDLKLMQEAGFNWVKQTFAWETIEAPVKGQFDWSISDRVVAQVNGRNLKLLARLSTDPEIKVRFWGGTPPGNGADFAEFAAAVAKRYNCAAGAEGCIHAFQIWNEPNLAREWGNAPPNPAQYVAFLRQTYAAIKQVHPNAIVISAGMAPTGSNDGNAMPDDVFYRQMYQAMGGNSNGYFDMLGVHGAGFAAPPDLDPGVAASNSQYGGYRFFSFRHVEDIRQIMVENGDTNKKVVLLEFGWTYDSVNAAYKWHGADAGIDAFKQGEYLKGAYEWATANWQPWIGVMSLLTMPNLDWLEDGNPEDEEQYWWAILDPSPIDQLYLRPAYVILCDHFNKQKGQTCIYAPKE